MIKVNCPSCDASYDVDEHRLPDKGLRMRCPKCSDSFQVHRDGSTARSGGGAAPGAKKPPRRKPTQVGLGPSAPPAAGPPPPPVAIIKPQPSNSRANAEEVDLPAPVGDREIADLPTPFAGRQLGDLPTPKKGGRSLDFDPFEDPGLADLPAPKNDAKPSGFDPFADIDLPAPFDSPGGTDLPAPMSHSYGGEIDLPVVKSASHAKGIEQIGDEVDLPMALSDAELPTPRRRSALPSAVPAPISLDSDLPMAIGEEDLPVARDDFMDLDLEGPERVHGGGPIELDLPDGGDLDLDMDLEPPSRAPGPPPPLGHAFGPPEEEPAEARHDGNRISDDSHELEFSELPGENTDGVHRMPRPAGAGQERVAAPKRKPKISMRRPPWLMKAVAGLGVIALLLGAGVYLGTTQYGLFGIHLIEPFLPAAGDELLVAQTIEEAEMIFAADTYAASQQALAHLQAARRDAGLNRALVARALLHESYHQVRYGQEATSSEIADTLRLHLQRRGDVAPRAHVALAADALRHADAATAKSELALAAQEDPNDAYVDLVAGELALRERDGQAARDAFGRALKKHESARAQWGLSRSFQILGDSSSALAAAKATLRLSPNHAAARVAVADSLIDDGKVDEAYALLQSPAGLAEANGAAVLVARSDQSAALTRIARIEESRGRLGAAREMYDKAIELDTSNANAALGAARLVLREGVYQDAYARFQTVLGSDMRPGAAMHPTGKPKVLVEAKLGAAEALLAMDKAEDAKKLLADLETEEPVSAEVELLQGKVAESIGDSKVAVKHFRRAILLAPKTFSPYMALAQHYSSTKRPGEAVAVLLEAQQNVEITAEVRRVSGWAELQRNRVDDAVKEFLAALEMDPGDSASRFGLAVAYRRQGKLEEAAAELVQIQELDAKFPGLALERGRLAEAGGDMDAAAARYREALKESPKDAALKSRLGAVLVLTGQLDEGEKLLREVLAAHPYSAEAEHYLGRIELERGQLESARQYFLRAARLENDNGLYRMYVAWVALEANEMTAALRELDATLKLDPTLGDAYWLRARIRIRAGTVRDALTDLNKAIELNPSRIEAWAAMGECHYQLGQMSEAISDWQKAVAGAPEHGYWWYRLGRLQLDEGRREEALTSLTTAASLGDPDPEDKGWLADAHRLTGDVYFAQKKRQEAVVEYGRYLELADPQAIDRADVEAKLRRIGQGLD